MTALAFGVIAVLGLGSVGQPAAAPPTMEQLTVPAERLPAGCALPASDAEKLESGRVSRGLWAGLRITSNPWIGADQAVMADIHARILGPMDVPDGPPPSAGEWSRYRLRLADGIEEAYAAVYRTPAADLTTVYAVRYAAGVSPVETVRRGSASNPLSLRLTIGRTVIVAAGGGADCFQAVAEHLRPLAK